MIRLLTSLIFYFCAAMLAACETTDVAPIQSGERPDSATDEAGLWLVMDEAERDLQRSAMVERDPALNAYVREIVCKVATEDFCNEVRVYIVKQPYFNANMAPNGVMQVWTGLMLRAEDEAQLAFVIGHEIAHYRQRHSLKQWREMKNAANASLIFGVGVAAAGVPQAAVLGDFTLAAQLYGYSRDKEREADKLGFQYFTEAGYDGQAAPAIWEYLLAEVEQSDSRRKQRRIARASIFSTHPVTSERVSNLKSLAAAKPGGSLYQDRYVEMTAPFLAQWLDDDLVRRDFGENIFLINSLIERGEQLGTLYYRRAEAYRIRRGEGDAARALADYETAITHRDAPASAWREIGEARRKAGQMGPAREAYRTYLSKAPNAPDRLLIESYIERGSS